MSLAAKIVALLKAHGVEWPGGAANARIVRTRASEANLSAGAWVWYLSPVDPSKGHFPRVGSQSTATAIARGPATVTYDERFDIYDIDTA